MTGSKGDKVNLELPIESVWLLPKLSDGAVVAPLGISLEGHNPARVRNAITSLVENQFVERVPGGIRITSLGRELLSKLDNRTSRGEAPVDAIHKAANEIATDSTSPEPLPSPPSSDSGSKDETSPPKKRLKGTQLRKEVLRVVSKQGPISSTDLANVLDVRSTTVMEHLHTLRDMGRVELNGWARAAKWRLVVRAETGDAPDDDEVAPPRKPLVDTLPFREIPKSAAPEGLLSEETLGGGCQIPSPKKAISCPLDSIPIVFRTTPAVADALDALVETGLWGADRNAAAEELVRIAIREMARRTP